MPTYIGLLRAVNLGGATQVPMAQLRELLAEVGLEEGRTLLQSGNVVFQSRARDETALERVLARAIAERMRVRTEVFVRSSEAWGSVVAGNPFVREARDDPSHLLVMALRNAPAEGRWKALEAAISGRERVHGSGRHAYLVYPDGIGRSRLTAARIESHLGTVGTARNWNTVTKLAELAATTGSPSRDPH